MRIRELHFVFLLAFVLSCGSFAGTHEFANMAVLLVKGYFKNYVSRSPSLEECVYFLNSRGVCFSLFDVMDSDAVVTPEEFARVVGQSTLLFLGEAEIESGCVEMPSGAESWVDYCLLNDVDSMLMYKSFRQRLVKGALPEVERFFGR